MPEMPEVEAVRQSLLHSVVGHRIERVIVTLPRLVRTPQSVAQFVQMLQNRTIEHVARVGKFLVFELSEDEVLISHLRMEGKYRCCPLEEPLLPHTHVRFELSNQTELRYQDVRQFGTFDLLAKQDRWTRAPLANVGIDPLTEAFSLSWCMQWLSHRSTKIKSLLLQQSGISGLGNIYADEALHRAGVHPERRALSLTEAEAERLYHAIRSVLTEAIASGGSTVRTYVNGAGRSGQYQHQLHVYGRQGQPCRTCMTPIVKYRLLGRGTHWCPRCQEWVAESSRLEEDTECLSV